VNIFQLLTRETQFCTRCYSHGKRVMVCSAAQLIELRKGRNERTAMRAYKARRLRAAHRHYRQMHPEVKL
jgi:hypothetical protein